MAQNAHNLNEGQRAAAEAFFEFLFTESSEFIISGPAGVGKTYLMNYIADVTMPRYLESCKLLGIEPEYTNVHMTATTNKAADVLAQSTGRPAGTIHSFLNLTVKNNFSTGRTDITRTNRWKIHENLIIFIDECSMIDSPLYKAIRESTLNCKIVFVGDHNQLAPVQEKLSPIYNQKSPFFELTQPMRNSGYPALMAVCQQLRETVETGVFKPIQTVPGIITHVGPDQMEWGIQQVFGQQTDKARILAYTNKRVIQFNDHIRHLRSLPAAFTKGECLINNSSAKIGKNTLPAESTVTVVAVHANSFVEVDEDDPTVKLEVQNLVLSYGSLDGISGEIPVEFSARVPVDQEHYQALIKYYAKMKKWSIHFALKENYMDLRPRDAATVHKAQGSTYDIVFIDLANISTCNITDQVARMLYVAFSRARTEIVLYGNLAPKYGSII